MAQDDDPDRWARLRFAIIGPLLAAPPSKGELSKALACLSQKIGRHPVTGAPVRFSAPTLERWFYTARNSPDPVAALRRRQRRDAGRSRQFSGALSLALKAQYRAYPGWTAQLHFDNLVALAEQDRALGPVPSYASVRRYLKAHGMGRQRRPKRHTPGAEQALRRLDNREVRSFEVDYVIGLWHLDFHHGSHKVVTAAGQWVTPRLLGIIDDRSRLLCHLQWYLDETAETLVHGFCQALQRRALPRALMSDNGAAMVAEEFRAGLHTLGIVHETTLPYSPYQNAKQESFWATIEGRLLAMLEGVTDLTLGRLNQLTQAWAEQEYHQRRHEEIGTTPLRRYLDDPSVGRHCPDSPTLHRAFRCTLSRRQRRSDGTISLAGKRFEIPARYRHLERVQVHYARWDLSQADLIDPHNQVLLCPLYPLDKSANASGQRRQLEPLDTALNNEPAPNTLPPLLRKLLADYAATGRPPPYLPKHDDLETET